MSVEYIICPDMMLNTNIQHAAKTYFFILFSSVTFKYYLFFCIPCLLNAAVTDFFSLSIAIIYVIGSYYEIRRFIEFCHFLLLYYLILLFHTF